MRRAISINKNRQGFTLSELLVVMGVIALMGILVVPALSSLKSAGDVTKTAYDIAGILEQARSYAMANNTYVFVGIAEEDATVSSTASPQVAGVGRVALAVVASQDGTRGYDATVNPLSTTSAWAIYANGANAGYNNGSNLQQVRNLQYFDGVHLVTTQASLPTTGGMTRQGGIPTADVIGNSACAAVTPFDWPLGAAIGGGKYSFKKVLSFDPQGTIRIQFSTNTTAVVPYLEMGLQPVHGNNPVSSSKDVAAIQIDGTTGAVRIYRP